MYCLQKIVEISYYNMNRIRLEWSNVWNIVGEHFNQVGCHGNQNVANFAVDSLRQLSVKFLEKEEMSQFKFQREFLKPFEHILANTTSANIKDMVLRCLLVMIQGRGQNIKSGWKSMHSVFAIAAKDKTESIVVLCFDVLKVISKERLKEVVMNNSFPDFTNCLVQFARNKKFPKTSLQAVEMLKGSIAKMAELSRLEAERIENEKDGSNADLARHFYSDEDPSVRFWFPIHFSFYEILMTCDLEVRSRALTYLFDCLKQYGHTYSEKFWSTVCKQVIFPIFNDVNKDTKREYETQEDMNEWMSTTLIQALRNFVDLFTYFFDAVSFLLEQILELLATCIKQDTETLSRIGASCLQQLMESNYNKLDDDMWDLIANTFTKLFKDTTPIELFQLQEDEITLEHNKSVMTLNEQSTGLVFGLGSPSASTANIAQSGEGPTKEQKKIFQAIVIKCVLQLLLIQTIQEVVLVHKFVYTTMKSKHILKLLDCLDMSHKFAKKFNLDVDLRLFLLKIGKIRNHNVIQGLLNNFRIF
jgi:brefeldin A-inhibited guanine nucleotide-exchange protein